MKVGCICKELVARNLEPCCQVGRFSSTTTTASAARKAPTSSTSISRRKSVDGREQVSDKCCGVDDDDDNSKSAPNAGTRCVSDREACSTVKKSGCCDAEKEDGCRDVTKKRRCSEEKEDDFWSSKKIQGECCSSEKIEDDCCESEKIDGNYCNLEKKKNEFCSLEKTIGSCCSFEKIKSNCCCSEKINRTGCKSETNKNDCCSLEKKIDGRFSSEKIKAGCCSSEITKSDCYSSEKIKDNCCNSEKNKTDYCNFKKETGGPLSREEISAFDNTNRQGVNHSDIEKGALFLDRVVLDVQGLTCVGCETKLFRSLQGISGVTNLRTSLVLSQAEFDLDPKSGLVTEIIKTVEKTTGFTCQRVNNDGHEIEIVINGDTRAFAERKYLDGVTQMIAIDSQTVRITFDARIIGARTLLENYGDISLKLAGPRGSPELESGKKHVRTTAWITILSALLTIPVLILAWAPLPPRPIVYGGVSLVLATIVQFVIAGPFYPSALRALIFTHVIEMDLLIVLSTSAAYIFSLVSFAYQVIGRPLPTGEFFETSTLLVTLIMLGRWVSAFARQRAVESVSIRSLQTESAILCGADGRDDEEIDARLLQYGDLFKVRPDSRIPTDGVIVMGTTEVNESMMTGESLPVEKLPGSSVIAGSLNGSGVVVVRLTHLPGDNTISTIATMVDEAKFSKPKTQELVDIVASYFVPVILTLTIITFASWIAVGISVRHQSGGHAAINAITYAISVLIVSCPCAIGLAVPMVVVISGGVAAKHGVIFKSATTIENARNVSHVVFDKTGTLTQGEMSVMEEVYLSGDEELVASVTLGLTRDSKHPVSAAISAHLKGKGVDAATVRAHNSVPGQGVEGIVKGARVRCGNTRWLNAEALPEVQAFLLKGLTVFCIARSDRVVAAFGLSDSLRPDSCLVVTELQKRNIAISIVSGDDAGAVEAVALKLNIPASQVKSRCTPSDKQAYIKDLMTNEKKKTVLFCGDGTNDAVALTQADIGVHMNSDSNSDVAQTAADVVLMRPSLGGILVLLDLSKTAFHRMMFNFAWSFVYNLFAILLAAGATVKARIPPEYAGLGEIVSVLPVILIAMQLRWFKREY